MALPGSGTLSFQDIEDELGGSGTISMTEYYGVSTLPASGTISVSDFYGVAAYSGNSFTQTNGNDGGKIPSDYGYLASNYGSIPSQPFLDIYGTNSDTITQLHWIGSSAKIRLTITSTGSVTNDTWTTLSLNGTVYVRSQAVFTSGTWEWDSGDTPAAANKFLTGTTACIFA